MQIREKRPDGRGSVKEVMKWWGNIDANMNDARPLWDSLEPGIKQALRYTFSGANPSRWPMTTQKHRDWKAKQGFPATIGYMTGELMRAFAESPKVKKKKKFMFWDYDKSRAGYKGKQVGEYAIYFNRTRNIWTYTKLWLKRSVIDIAVRKWLSINKREEK